MWDPRVLDLDGLDELIRALAADGRTVVGPTRQGSVVDLDEIESAHDLPAGWSDHQVPGHYRLEPGPDRAVFGHTTTPSSPRRYLHPPHETLVRIRRSEDGFEVDRPEQPPAPAFVGVRPCDVAAIDVADRVAATCADEDSVRRRADTVVVAAACTRAGPTCFCASLGTGPEPTTGHDLVLTELLDEDGHRFLAEVATARGAALLERVTSRPAPAADRSLATRAVESARRQERSIETDGLHHALLGALEHERWDDVARRCLSCGSCTLACPTCFCTTIEDRTDLDGASAERNRRWESCFSLDHSHLGSGSVRDTVRDRYRQWLTHKLGTWIDQFGELGCVGCGRCLTWCPVGIDLTVEARALREPVPAPEPVR